MNGISIMFVAASLFGLSGILSIPIHAIFAKMAGREPVRVLNWFLWIFAGAVLMVLMISAGFLDQFWSWIFGEIFFALIIAILMGEFSLIKSDYLVYSRKSVLKWWQVLAMNWSRGYALIFNRAKKPASKATNWVWGQIKPRLWWLTPLIIILVAPRWWVGYFIIMVVISVIVLDHSSRVPWYVRYQGRQMRPMPRFQPYNSSWVDPDPDIIHMPGMRVPFISWVPHWLSTVMKKQFWIWTGVAVACFALAIWIGWWPMCFIGYLLFVIPIGVMEGERWNDVYTLIDDGTIYRLSSSLQNWRPDIVVYNLRKSIGQTLNQEVLLEPFGCIRKTGVTAEGGGGTERLEWIPWIDVIGRVLNQVMAPAEMPNNLWFLSGLHWLHGIEIFTSFLNKLGDIFDAAKNSWDWLDPNIRLEDAGFKINRKWPIAFRPDRKTLDLQRKTDKAFFLSYWLWIAWKKYQEVLPKPYIRGAEQARLNHLQEMVQTSGLDVSTLVATPIGHAWLVALDHINSATRPFMPAVQAWLGQACSPLSETWKTMTLPALETVMPMWGSLTDPGPGTAMFKKR